MKKILILLLTVFASFSLFAQFDEEYSDNLFYLSEDYDAEYQYLTASLEDAADDDEKAEILWRLSRNVLTQGDQLDRKDKNGRFEKYEKAEDLANESLAAKENADAYFWRSSAVGRWGQTKGPLDSLGKARGMQSDILKVVDDYNYDFTDAWYVLSLLYSQLPGSPISFGNKNYAISYMRRSLDTQLPNRGLYLTLYLELSDQLWKRNWNAEKRTREIDEMKASYDSNTLPSEKMKYYEGANGSSAQPFYSSVTLSQMSDRQEAIMLLQYAMAMYDLYPEHRASDTARYQEIVDRYGERT